MCRENYFLFVSNIRYLFLQVFNLPPLDFCLVFKVTNSLQIYSESKRLRGVLLCWESSSIITRSSVTGTDTHSTDLVRLVQQLHPLLEDLAVVLSTLPQHLPPQLLHRRPQLVPLELIQRLVVLYYLGEGE